MTATTLVVGDIHGCADELAALLDRVGPDRVVLVGDLYTRGPKPEAVWDQVRAGGFQAVLGNHDDRLLEAAAGGRPHDTVGAECVARLDAADATSTAGPPRSWLAWLAARPLFSTLEAMPSMLPAEGSARAGFVVVHAGLHPVGGVQATTRKAALTLRRWPDERATDPLWWQLYRAPAPALVKQRT